jgi:hypothetical protein
VPSGSKANERRLKAYTRVARTISPDTGKKGRRVIMDWIYLRPVRPNALPPPADLNPPDRLDAAKVPTGRPMPIGLLTTTGPSITTGLFMKKGELAKPNPNPNRGPMKSGE